MIHMIHISWNHETYHERHVWKAHPIPRSPCRSSQSMTKGFHGTLRVFMSCLLVRGLPHKIIYISSQTLHDIEWCYITYTMDFSQIKHITSHFITSHRRLNLLERNLFLSPCECEDVHVIPCLNMSNLWSEFHESNIKHCSKVSYETWT